MNIKHQGKKGTLYLPFGASSNQECTHVQNDLFEKWEMFSVGSLMFLIHSWRIAEMESDCQVRIVDLS